MPIARFAVPPTARAALLLAARLLLLVGATVLAFFTGGYFPEAQAWTGLIAWGLVALSLLLAPRPVRIARPGWVALLGLALLGCWTLVSITWAPVAGSAYHAGQLAMAYAGVLLAAMLLLRGATVHRGVEPLLAAGTLVVIGYGILGRLLPGLLHLARSLSAQGRLEQPLTYWNAMGELAALGLVLSVRLAGDRRRSAALRATGLAASVVLGLGVYLSFSRGALFASAAGLIALVVAAPRREQLEAIALGIAGAAIVSAVTAQFSGVASLAGSLGSRERQGAIVLGLVVVIASAAAAAQWRLARRGRAAALRLPRRAPWIALALTCAGLGLAIAVGSKEGTRASLSGSAARYGTLQSNRYDYWQVALKAFSHQPVRGVGAGGWAVWWLRYRKINDFAQDAHSLPLQTLAELGLVGVLLLGTFVGGVAFAARAAHRAAPGLAAGPIAGLVVYAAHAPLDWDWQMPAVTLVALVLAGGVASLDVSRPAASREPRLVGSREPVLERT